MNLLIDKHERFFKFALTVLPDYVTSLDSSLIGIAYFSLCGLDLIKTPIEKIYKDRLEWVYKLLVPSKEGFRGSLTHEYEEDPPHIAATYFGLCILATLKDTEMISKLDRYAMVKYLKKCQRKDGSFAPIYINGEPSGEEDTRYSLCAVSIRSMLFMNEPPPKEIDINVEKAIEFVKSVKTIDGGYAMNELGESHAGLTFCSIVTLSLLGAIGIDDEANEDTVRWLVHRQIGPRCGIDEISVGKCLEDGIDVYDIGGFNGRTSKIADTCYSFWVLGALSVLKPQSYSTLIDVGLLERYMLLETQQPIIGGFSKNRAKAEDEEEEPTFAFDRFWTNNGNRIDNTPDVYHSFLGLAACGLAKSEHLRGLLNDFDGRLCISTAAVLFLRGLGWDAASRARE